MLTAIWCEVLRRERVDRDENFFDLGGQSVQAMTILEKTAARLGLQLPLVTIFQHPTISEMVQVAQSLIPETPDSNI